VKIHTTNYKNTFIEIAPDSPVSKSEIPPVKQYKTLANIQFEMIANNPYRFSSDDVMLECYMQKNNIPETEKLDAEKDFFSKGQACFRCAALTKRYGFGIHHNAEGKIALYPIESNEYENFLKDDSIIKVKAMRIKREKQKL
jgi:hypothetical protein